MKKILTIVCTVCALLVLFFAFLLFRRADEDLDPSGYVQAVLALQFQGETDDARSFESDVTVTELKNQYTSFITSITTMMTEDLDMSDSEKEEFSEELSQMLMSMQYDVGEAQKEEDGSYNVPVTIWPTDAFIQYRQLLTQDSLALAQKVKDGEISGSDEEVEKEIKKEIAGSASILLEDAVNSSTYGDEETVNLNVKASKGSLSIDEEDMNTLVTKILRLDES